MRLHFHGACRSVTGSCFLLTGPRSRILVDCGMVQGSKSEKELNYRAFPFRPADLDAVVLSHAHIDHSGLLPKLVKDGFSGPIYATPASIDLCSIMLPDSGHIQEMEVDQLNRRNARRGKGSVEPIYTVEDAEACMDRFRPLAIGDWAEIADGFRVRLWRAGHLLGSASIEVEAVNPDGRERPLKILFSGDIGPNAKLFEQDPEGPTGMDHIVCEATYGDIVRPAITTDERRALLLDEVQSAARRDGALLIPSFAVERTQELLTDLVGLMESGALPDTRVFIDSPMASRATGVFAEHAGEIEHGDLLVRAMRSSLVRFTESTEQSKALAKLNGFHIVISASGMCEAGRIRHHLRNWLWRSSATVLLVGFQAQGTLGRILLDGARHVRIMGEEIEVHAQIRSLDLYSGHADAAELVSWIRQRLPLSGKLFLVHGEEDAMEALAGRLSRTELAGSIVSPTLDTVFELARTGATALDATGPVRLTSDRVGHLDWHNDLSRLILDIDEAIRSAADEKGRAKLIRRLRRALENE